MNLYLTQADRFSPTRFYVPDNLGESFMTNWKISPTMVALVGPKSPPKCFEKCSLDHFQTFFVLTSFPGCHFLACYSHNIYSHAEYPPDNKHTLSLCLYLWYHKSTLTFRASQFPLISPLFSLVFFIKDTFLIIVRIFENQLRSSKIAIWVYCSKSICHKKKCHFYFIYVYNCNDFVMGST